MRGFHPCFKQVIAFLGADSLRRGVYELLLSVTDESFTQIMSLEAKVEMKLIS